MTKYILHGGAARRDTEDNKEFFIEIVKDIMDPVNVLIVCYAKDKKIWEEAFESVKESFKKALPQKHLNFVLAGHNTEGFKEQLKEVNAVYILGGNTHILQEYLEKVPDLVNLLKNKTIAGSSAGALVFSSYYYENDDDTYNKGLGILPYKTFCHYTEEKTNKLKKLKGFGKNIKIHAIPEEKYIVIKK
ncbi:Type 1 glutamine amidotransferase-like domain-containing protein [Patescibacteria group bacterium]|nr:Type 1 glutamine amidotransferase-like domain-containing protein [Patescibacteria group bacterium]MBU1889999.1 Type 1 glutamine amidotransferase-like domain-containing protein [Patescibacteria group bacterium]